MLQVQSSLISAIKSAIVHQFNLLKEQEQSASRVSQNKLNISARLQASVKLYDCEDTKCIGDCDWIPNCWLFLGSISILNVYKKSSLYKSKQEQKSKIDQTSSVHRWTFQQAFNLQLFEITFLFSSFSTRFQSQLHQDPVSRHGTEKQYKIY